MPGMGWSTFNFFVAQHNDNLLRQMGDAFAASGLWDPDVPNVVRGTGLGELQKRRVPSMPRGDLDSHSTRSAIDNPGRVHGL
jgi:hypothetical protein